MYKNASHSRPRLAHREELAFLSHSYDKPANFSRDERREARAEKRRQQTLAGLLGAKAQKEARAETFAMLQGKVALRALNARRAARRAAERAGLICHQCGKQLIARRPTARFCDATCRSRAWRAKA